MERINVRVDERLKRELEAEAKEKGVRPSEIVRRVLEEHVRQQTPAETCFDIAKRLGLIGIYKDAPTDLSTNPEHMEGFGAERFVPIHADDSPREGGQWKGRVRIADDFDALPADVADAFGIEQT